MKKILTITLILFLSLFSYSEWKNKISEYWDDYEDFSSIIRYLERDIEKISKVERAEALAILSYAYKNENNIAGEVSCIKKLFMMFKFKSISPDFLDLSARMKIFDYIERWKKVFPEISGVEFCNIDDGLSYFSPPEFINLKIYSSTSAGMKLIDSLNRVVFSVFLKSGKNLVKIPMKIVEVTNNITKFTINVYSGSVSINYKFTVEKEYKIPLGINFNPNLGFVKLIDRNFKKESKKIVKKEGRRYFDKKMFLKKSLIPLGVGITFFCVGNFLTNSETVSPDKFVSRQSLWSFGKSSKYFGVGFSIKSIVDLIRSFKKINTYKVYFVEDPDSIHYNNLLRKILKKKKMLIRVKLKLTKMERENE